MTWTEDDWRAYYAACDRGDELAKWEIVANAGSRGRMQNRASTGKTRPRKQLIGGPPAGLMPEQRAQYYPWDQRATAPEAVVRWDPLAPSPAVLATAIHEGAHALACELYIDSRVDEVSVYQAVDGSTSGDCAHDHAGADVFRRAVGLVAGVAAEAMFTPGGDEPIYAAGGLPDGSFLEGSDGDKLRELLPLLRVTSRAWGISDPTGWGSINAAYLEARNFLGQHRDTLIPLQQALIQRGRLSGDEIRELIHR
jgi:hypothetical protein